MNRRGFFSAIAAVAATAAMDPERLLWVPGKLISIPKALPSLFVATPEMFQLGDIITFAGVYVKDPRTRRSVPPVLQKYVVTAAGRSFSDIRFRYADPARAALIRPL